MELLITKMKMEVEYKLFITIGNQDRLLGEYKDIKELKNAIKSMLSTGKAETEQLYVIRHRFITDKQAADWFLQEFGSNGYTS